MVKYTILTGMAAMLAFSSGAMAQNAVVTDASLTRTGSVMTAALTLEGGGVKVKSCGEALFTPMIVNGADTLRLPSVGLYGRSHWYQLLRRNGQTYPGQRADIPLRQEKKMEPLRYEESVAYQPWMNGASLIVERTDYACTGTDGEEETIDGLASYRHVDYEPQFIFALTENTGAIVKTAELSGRAYIDFQVNRTDILPDFRRNAAELAKITGTIDSVRNDKDITVTSLTICGYASPEGPYENNVRLAKGRTEALKDYVQRLYKFPQGLIKSDYVPVDWAGLKEWLEKSQMENREGIIAIIDGSLEPAQKNGRIQKDYPTQYRYLLENVYPGLRHSDYRIEYEIRTYTEVDEIAEVMRTAPQKLSLSEMYLLASTLEPGSDAYNDVYETAVRMFPNDERANINAANAAMMRGDYSMAERYLQRAGNSAEALYARGVLAALKGNLSEGRRLMETAAAAGLQGTDAILQNIREAEKYSE